MFSLIELRQDRLDANQKILASVCQRYCSRVPGKKHNADFTLQRSDRPRRRRLRNIQFAAGRREASHAGDPNEQPQREQAVARSEDG